MKLNQLIKRLTNIQTIYGDHEVEYKNVDESLDSATTIDSVHYLYDGTRQTVLLEGSQ